MAHDLRVLVRVAPEYRPGQQTAVIIDNRTVPSTPESGRGPATTGTSGARGSKVHIAVDTLA